LTNDWRGLVKKGEVNQAKTATNRMKGGQAEGTAHNPKPSPVQRGRREETFHVLKGLGKKKTENSEFGSPNGNYPRTEKNASTNEKRKKKKKNQPYVPVVGRNENNPPS